LNRTRWLLVSIGKEKKFEGFGGIQTHRERERERERGTDLRKPRRKGGIAGGDDRKWIAVFRNLRLLLTASGLTSSPRRVFLSCLSVEEVIEKEFEKSLSIINWKTFKGVLILSE
jgi:hypothetical protein